MNVRVTHVNGMESAVTIQTSIHVSVQQGDTDQVVN